MAEKREAKRAPHAAIGARVGRWFVARGRVLAGLTAGVAVALLLPDMRLPQRLLIGWDAGLAVFLVATWRVVATASVAHVRRRAADEDERSPVIFIVMLAAVVASLAGIVVAIRGAEPDDATTAAIVSGATLLLSWLSMHTMFALHYAHLYYGDAGTDTIAGGLVFPGAKKDHAYGDFAYLALCIGTTCQVSDVDVVDGRFRRLIATHGVLSFFYNTFVLALAINLLSGIFGGG